MKPEPGRFGGAPEAVPGPFGFGPGRDDGGFAGRKRSIDDGYRGGPPGRGPPPDSDLVRTDIAAGQVCTTRRRADAAASARGARRVLQGKRIRLDEPDRVPTPLPAGPPGGFGRWRGPPGHRPPGGWPSTRPGGGGPWRPYGGGGGGGGGHRVR